MFWGKTKGLLFECYRPYSGNLRHSKIFQHLGNVSNIQHIVLYGPHGLWACQVPLSMEFSRQEYWSELSCPPPPGDPPKPGIEPASLMSPALADGFFRTTATWEAC